MTDRIDHAAEARRHIDWAHEQQEREGDMGNAPRDAALIAQVHATLALVEQQRIANLIALTALAGNPSIQESDFDEGAELASAGLHALIEYAPTPGTQISGPDEHPVIRADVREGLGL